MNELGKMIIYYYACISIQASSYSRLLQSRQHANPVEAITYNLDTGLPRSTVCSSSWR